MVGLGCVGRVGKDVLVLVGRLETMATLIHRQALVLTKQMLKLATDKLAIIVDKTTHHRQTRRYARHIAW